MKIPMYVGLLFAVVWPCAAEQVLREFDWRKLRDANVLRGGEVLELDGRPVLKIANTNNSPIQLQLLKIESPGVSKFVYALTGDIRYEAVQGVGYLEMWNFYPPVSPGMPEGQYFSRTLAQGGQMGHIAGTCNWRSFVLPFDHTGASNPPVRLEFNIFLPARGIVFLSPVKLVEYEGKGLYAIKSKPGAWWGERVAGVIGAFMGTMLGIWGSLAAALAYKGRGRSFVMATMKVWTTLGVGFAVAGAIALALGQPFEVWFLLLLPAVILIGISMRSFKDYKRRYEELELRKMAAVDVGDR
jgi:hypothetical protein